MVRNYDAFRETETTNLLISGSCSWSSISLGIPKLHLVRSHLGFEWVRVSACPGFLLSTNQSDAGDSRNKWTLWNTSKSTRAPRVFGEGTTTLAPLEEQVLEVLHEQASRGQIIVLPEQEAKERYPSLVIASLGAKRKEKPDGRITARVLFDGTNGLEVNKRTGVRHQGKGPVAADLKRSMRARAARGEKTFAVTGDATEAHRQVPIKIGGCWGAK